MLNRTGTNIGVDKNSEVRVDIIPRMAMESDRKAVGERSLEGMASTLKPRRKVLLASLISGNGVTESARIAGYAHPERAGTLALQKMRESLPELMDAIGMSTRDLLTQLNSKRKASKIIAASWNGEFTDVMEVDDHPIQMDAIKLALRLHGHLTPDSGDGAGHLTVTISNVVNTKDE